MTSWIWKLGIVGLRRFAGRTAPRVIRRLAALGKAVRIVGANRACCRAALRVVVAAVDIECDAGLAAAGGCRPEVDIASRHANTPVSRYRLRFTSRAPPARPR